MGVISESADPDFETEFGTTESARAGLAKDVAAMTAHGGVIVIGVIEAGGVADRLMPVALDGLVERVQQVIDSHVRPPPAVEISIVRELEADSDGLVVVEISPSRLAPHYANESFPRRSGPVTAYMANPFG
ncbi:MAG: ATP-binding protein [Thermoleophilia bacterium]|nr:ATP-binding protein [Thermoleophilia bacterium]